MTFHVVLLLACALLGCPQKTACARTMSQARVAATTLNVCIPNEASAAELSQCDDALSLANTEQVNFACISGGSDEGCMSKIRDGSADLTTLGASGLLPAYEQYGLLPLVAELYGDSKSPTEYFSVAVVNKEFCDIPDVSLASLKGSSMCSTGYRKTAGWVAPVGLLAESGVMDIVSTDPSIQSDAQSVSKFFANVCAPRTTEDGPQAGGLSYPPLCTGCQGDCSTEDTYYNYDGAFRCLMEGNGDVSFTKDDIVSTLARDGSSPAVWATKNKDDFRLVCPNGGCQKVDDYSNCNFGRVPSHAIIGTKTLQGSSLGDSVKTALLSAASSPEFLSAATNMNGLDNFFLSDGTTGLIRIDSSNFDDFFDPSLQKSFAGVKALEDSQTFNAPETTAGIDGTTVICFPVNLTSYGSFPSKCNEAFATLINQNITFSCSTAPSAEECMAQVKSGAATLAKVGPSDIFLGNRDYGLEPIVSEYYGGDVGNNYYSVAVVRKDFCQSNPSLRDLRGKRSCHTGFRRTAGWSAPVGFLVDTQVMPVKNSDKSITTDAETVTSFFSKTCAVGSNADGPSTGGGPWSGLCTACGGDCSEDSVYAGYEGSVRGLMEDACDVAFTKQEVAPIVASDGTGPESWSTLTQDDMRLLCPLGGCKPIDEWQNCNMAAIPAQAFVGKVDIQRTADGASIKKALVEAGKDSNFLNVARDIAGTGSYILSANTQSLQEVPVDQSSFDYLGKGTTQAYLGIQSLEEAPESDSGGLSSGAIAGIVIGSIAAGILIGAAIFIWYKKSGGKRFSYEAYQADKEISTSIM